MELLLASDRRRDEEDSFRFLLSRSSTFKPGTLPGIFLEIENKYFKNHFDKIRLNTTIYAPKATHEKDVFNFFKTKEQRRGFT